MKFRSYSDWQRRHLGCEHRLQLRYHEEPGPRRVWMCFASVCVGRCMWRLCPLKTKKAERQCARTETSAKPLPAPLGPVPTRAELLAGLGDGAFWALWSTEALVARLRTGSADDKRGMLRELCRRALS